MTEPGVVKDPEASSPTASKSTLKGKYAALKNSGGSAGPAGGGKYAALRKGPAGQSSASGSASPDGGRALGLGTGGPPKPIARKGRDLLNRKPSTPQGPPDTLLVEDVPVSRKIAEVACKKAKYNVISTGTGEDAVKLFREHSNSLKIILMDIGLGIDKMSGIDAAKAIRAIEEELKLEPKIILGLTGNFGADDLEKYKAAQMNGCIAKGELLVKSVGIALQKLKENPDEFVALTDVPASSVPVTHVVPDLSHNA